MLLLSSQNYAVNKEPAVDHKISMYIKAVFSYYDLFSYILFYNKFTIETS